MKSVFIFNFKKGDFMAYQTKQGELLLDFLRRNEGGHLSAQEIALRLAQEGSAIGQTTVYRHLEKLVAQGSVRKFTGEQESGACYQYAKGCEVKHHHHLKCAVCGALLHMECGYLDDLTAHVRKEHGFVLDPTRTVLYGCCAKCAKENV